MFTAGLHGTLYQPGHFPPLQTVPWCCIDHLGPWSNPQSFHLWKVNRVHLQLQEIFFVGAEETRHCSSHTFIDPNHTQNSPDSLEDPESVVNRESQCESEFSKLWLSIILCCHLQVEQQHRLLPSGALEFPLLCSVGQILSLTRRSLNIKAIVHGEGLLDTPLLSPSAPVWSSVDGNILEFNK